MKKIKDQIAHLLTDHLEVILIVASILTILYLTMNNPPQINTTKAGKVDTLQMSIDSLKSRNDSATIVENNLTKKITINNNYYEAQRNIIIHSSDSINAERLHSELARYSYILDSTGS